MDWEIRFSRQAEKFLARRHLPDEVVVEPLQRAIRKLQGETIAVDVKRLSGAWKGYYRVRVGKIRIIFSLNPTAHTLFVEVVDNRGGAYQ